MRELIKKIDLPVFLMSGGVFVIFIALALINVEALQTGINTLFGLSTKFFGPFWYILVLLYFIIGMYIAFSKYGNIKIGRTNKIEFTKIQWLSMVMCTLLAGVGVFWAAAEPIAHFASAPPFYGETENQLQKAYNALSQSFLHGGFLVWSIMGSTLIPIAYAYLVYYKKLPLRPRTLLYPIFGERALTNKGVIGPVTDAFCILAVMAGTIGPIGFLGAQLGYGLEDLFGFTNGFGLQATMIGIVMCVYVMSASTGLSKGIKYLSQANIYLTLFLFCFILLFGPFRFIFSTFIGAFGQHLGDFLSLATYTQDPSWSSSWTYFFWAWFLGYSPLMGIFVIKVSKGRTLRELIVTMSLIAPIITMLWFTVLGGSGLHFEITNPGSVLDVFNANGGFNIPGTLLSITKQLPLGKIVSVLFLILSATFIVTTGDSMSFTISSVSLKDTGDHSEQDSSRTLRIFWGLAMGFVAIILLYIGGVSALQSFIVITAVPVSLILIPPLLKAMTFVKAMYKTDHEDSITTKE
ncbi:BCCT family transporter [Polaribacter sp.]|nr:BCCT family transporter [Polaribacter sp.]